MGKFALCPRDLSQAADLVALPVSVYKLARRVSDAQLSPNCLYAYNERGSNALDLHCLVLLSGRLGR